MERICKNCLFWKRVDEKWASAIVGICDLEPGDIRDMKSDQCAVVCGHDGAIHCGENFGCIHWAELE